MKFTNLTRSVSAIAILGMALIFNACKREEEVFPAPTLTAGAAANGLAGATVKITATINAPAGMKTLTVLKNGQAFDSKSYTGAEISENYSKDYVVENLPTGSAVTFSFQATDQKNQASTLATQVVTVSAVPAKQIVDVRGLLTGNISWTKDKIYRLIGFVRLGGDTLAVTPANVTTGILTIEAGTVLFGSSGADSLVINRGSQIFAEGTATKPIIFTSRANIEGTATDTSIGQWGGIVVLGRAPISACTGAGKARM